MRLARSIGRRPPVAPAARYAHLPAPTDGLNKSVAGDLMPAGDCVSLVNMLPGANGQKVRPGYQEWFTGLEGASGNEVRSILPFSGSTTGNSKLFACTNYGIFDVTTSRQRWDPSTAYVIGDIVVNDKGKYYTCDTDGTSASSGGPTGTGANIADGTTRWDYTGTTLGHTFGTQTGNAGYGISAAMVTSAGHFLLYCDEVNGYHVYTEGGAWTDIASGVGATEVSGLNPDNAVFVAIHQNRVWLVERDTASAWYLAAGAIYGAATEFNFGRQFRAGGHLVGLWSMTYDGGAGMNDHLVAVSSGGDVVIYSGVDPSAMSSWGLVGTWNVGGVVGGRRIATERGGDVLLTTSLGTIPVSDLVLGKVREDSEQYETRKIGPYFTQLSSAYGSLRDWGLYLNPADNSLLLAVPSAASSSTNQLAMSLSRKAWCQYYGLPLFSAGTWGRELYFGTVGTESQNDSDTLDRGRVCKVTGVVDNVQLTDSTYDAIDWSCTTSFSSLGSPHNKQLQAIRPVILSGQTTPLVNVEARYDYDLTDASAPTGSPTQSGTGWDQSVWDTDIWDGELAASNQNFGCVGMGRHIAVAIKGKSVTETTLVGFDIAMTNGGGFF